MTPELASLLQQHLAGTPTSETLAALAGDDPQLSAIAQFLAQRERQLEDELRDGDLGEDGDDGDDPVVITGYDSRVEVLRDQVDHLASELARIQSTLDTVSGALGACPACLGADASCPLCRGRGVPGSLPPDPAAFDLVVLPAVRAHAYSRSRTARGPDSAAHASAPAPTAPEPIDLGRTNP